MSDPVDIKIAHLKKIDSSNNVFNNEEVYEIFGRFTPDALAPFYRFQQTWVNKAYATFKDFDTYLICMYLIQNIYVNYSDRFHLMSLDSFYDQDKIAIDKINLIQIAKSLNIPKETVRRKINFLQESDIIFRSGKSIYLNNKALEILKPNNSLPMLAVFFEKMSIILSKENWFGRPLTREEVEKFIKDHFTVCWEYFYRFQIPYLTRHRTGFSDLESWNVWGSVAIVQTAAFSEELKKITRENLSGYDNYYIAMLKYKPERGINASSISDISGIPRATVIRKLRTLEKKGFIKRNNKLEYTLGQAKNLKAFHKNYLINQKNLSDFCTTCFNLMKNSKFKIN